MADYLEGYAKHFDLPVRTGVRVDHLAHDGDHFHVHARDQRFQSNVDPGGRPYLSADVENLLREKRARVRPPASGALSGRFRFSSAVPSRVPVAIPVAP